MYIKLKLAGVNTFTEKGDIIYQSGLHLNIWCNIGRLKLLVEWWTIKSCIKFHDIFIAYNNILFQLFKFVWAGNYRRFLNTFVK
jgi:hypothetical protein